MFTSNLEDCEKKNEEIAFDGMWITRSVPKLGETAVVTTPKTRQDGGDVDWKWNRSRVSASLIEIYGLKEGDHDRVRRDLFSRMNLRYSLKYCGVQGTSDSILCAIVDASVDERDSTLQN